MFDRCISIVLGSLCGLAGLAAADLTSPDGKVHLQFRVGEDGRLLQAVTSDGHARLEPSPVGLILDGNDLGAKASLGSERTRTISEIFPWRGPKTLGTNSCRVCEIPVRSGEPVQEWTLEARVFNDGVAFRYCVPRTNGVVIDGEATTWSLPREATVWFQTNTDDYEGEYHAARADAVPLEEVVRDKKRSTRIGLPMTVVYPDRQFGLLSEACLYRFSGLSLRAAGDARFRAVFEDDPKGWAHSGRVVSPWRVLVLAKDLNGLVNSDLIAALGEPPDPRLFPDGMNTSWIRPGKAPCTWMVYGNDGAQWNRQKQWVDLCAATGCEYLLVDAGWRTERWGWLQGGANLWERVAELCRYGAERKVGIFLWHAYPEGRDDGPGLTTVEAREELFRNCREAGVRGVKIDFFNSESRAVVDAYEDLLRGAARHQLMINFHGANKPTGEPRTWPNEITREGIREQEYVLWGELPLAHYGALPFTRMAAGHADFLPGYVRPKYLKNTTVIFQMAAVVVYSSPFLCWADDPAAYVDSPLLHFIRTVPTTWDETRVLPGSVIGETVILARRREAVWYVAALNCRAEPREIELDLSFLGAGGRKMTVYRDGATAADCRIETGVALPQDGRWKESLRPGGGFLGRIGPTQ